jgi:hypothetical protein
MHQTGDVEASRTIFASAGPLPKKIEEFLILLPRRGDLSDGNFTI